MNFDWSQPTVTYGALALAIIATIYYVWVRKLGKGSQEDNPKDK